MKLEFYVSKWKFGHDVVIRDVEKEQDIYRRDLASFVGSKLACIIKITQDRIDDYGFITYKILNPKQVLKVLDEE